jgi:hypothetical protein
MATASAKPSGNWRGSLVDSLGYEGSLSLELTARKGRISGACTATISDHHEPFVRSGKVSGTAEDGHLTLQISFARAEEEVTIALDAHAFELSDKGGAGMCGTYEVAARSFSPLQGGVVALSRDLPTRAIEAKEGGR